MEAGSIISRGQSPKLPDRKIGKKQKPSSSGDDGAARQDAAPRYEFDAAKFPKGHRTERDKRKSDKPGRENADKVVEDCPKEAPRHLKKPRTSRATGKPKTDNHSKEGAADHFKTEEAAGDQEDAETHENERADQAVVEETVADAAEVKEVVTVTGRVDELLVQQVEKEQQADTAAAVGEEDTGGKLLETPATDEDKELPTSAIARIPQELTQQEAPEVHTPPPRSVDDGEQKVENAEPDTSLSLGISGSRAAPSNRGRSFQSVSQAETFSNGITTSLSLSCSHQHFAHNPSCSLTQTSHDQEFSTATQPMCHQDATEMSHGSWQMSIGARGGLPHSHSGKPRDHHHEASNRRKTASESTHPKGSLRKKKPAVHSTGSWGADGLPYGGVSVREIVCGPASLVAQKMNELPAKMIDGLKTTVMDLLECTDRKQEFFQLQKLLEARIDLSTETLLHCNRAQLEILVALKTGIRAFLLQERPLQSPVLAEVFLHLKCQNIHCLNQLPGDNCECQVCSQKNGFCNTCMCVVCSKFDFDANTCRWVGCDYCLHWCHTDCGIRKAFIRPGPSIRGAAGTSEMQYHCVACGHTSELFGFVKAVYTTCAKEWSKEILAKELDCVRRMFHGSEDTRGKQLCWKSDLMLKKLEANHDVAEVCSTMLKFFEGGEAVQQLESDKRTEMRSKPYDSDPAAVLERASLALQNYDSMLEEKRTDAVELQYERARKKAEIEELESIMRIKQAEAKMFQARADEAAREAEGLQRIVLAKFLKVEEEYNCKKLKLQIEEAEQRRKRKFEDVQLLQKGSDNFEIMRNLMVDLQGLLKTMDPAVKCCPRPDAQRYS